MVDLKKRRRQVAWLCFQPHLSKAQLIQAINILEQSYQNEGVSHLVAYVTKICSEFNIDLPSRINLYGQFREMMKAETALSMDEDPLVFIQEKSHDGLAFKQAEAVQYKIDTVNSTAVDLGMPPKVPAHTAIFIHFMKQIYTAVPERSAFLQMIKELSLDKKQGKKDRDSVSRWLDSPDNFAWAVGLDEKALASLVHLVYTSLCEILGPVQADGYFHKIIAHCEKMPEAAYFSPARFL